MPQYTITLQYTVYADDRETVERLVKEMEDMKPDGLRRVYVEEADDGDEVDLSQCMEENPPYPLDTGYGIYKMPW